MLNRSVQEKLAQRYAGAPTQGMLKKAFDQRLFDALHQKQSTEGSAHSVAVFVDVAGFSNTVSGFNASNTREFLDDYYAVAVPEIYDRQGHIDRIVGDGIVAIFSSFLPGEVTDATAHLLGLQAIEAIVRKLHGTVHNSKAALVEGTLLYCKTGLTNVYEDYTVIGEPLTIAYRIEEIARADQVIFPADSETSRHVYRDVAKRAERESRGAAVPTAEWIISRPVPSELRGIGRVELTTETYQG